MSSRDPVEALNAECVCISLDAAALQRALESELGRPGLYQMIAERCPHLFSVRPVFVASEYVRRMREVIAAAESVIGMPSFREGVLAGAPDIARSHQPGAKGVFLGYDFHVSHDKVSLIEINTNAGGALLNVALARAQRACCKEIEHLLPSPADVNALEQDIVTMFHREWHLSGHTRPLRTIAIVDESPTSQYLYPEFLLFQRLFERQGLQAVIADPTELALRDGALWYESTAIDLVYNRLTDFALDAPPNAGLREAYLQRAVVLTPHPLAHALYADKRNLVVLSDETRLTEIGVPADVREVLLTNIPRTELVTVAQADRFWSERRQWFFKPASGFGSKAAYRGDKITQRVWREILAGTYVAQKIAAPGERASIEEAKDGAVSLLKFDLRNYAYDGAVQWVAARVYQGQTTNFRTPGGGFAPIYTANVA